MYDIAYATLAAVCSLAVIALLFWCIGMVIISFFKGVFWLSRKWERPHD